MLDNASTRGRARSAKVRGDGNAEASLVGVVGACSRGKDVPRDQGRTNDLVGGSVNNGNVGSSGVGSADVELEVHLLTSTVALDLVGVVGVLETLAQPNVALGGIVVGLSGCDLEFTLDVTIVVASLVVVDLLAASRLEALQSQTLS